MLESRNRYSVRLRGKKYEVKDHRRSANIVMNDDRSEDTKVATLDPVVGGTGMQHNLRPLLRDIYMKRESEKMKYPVDMHSSHGRIKHCGLIDRLSETESTGESSR